MTIATDVEARADGSGVIRAGVGLDREALAQVPELGEQLQVDDLRRAGWRVAGRGARPTASPGSAPSLPFATPAEARRAVAQLNGPGARSAASRVTREGSRVPLPVRFTGTVDLGRGLEGFADAELERRLGDGQPRRRRGDAEASASASTSSGW